ncbi:hypothetical protein [Martelella limonii]|uniref:hypothetical protein n=1 Tax=Martelella limonii TaxID=1647649 RepID=UPI001580FB22|nr:hypothetical protein [Martelella limonii]
MELAQLGIGFDAKDAMESIAELTVALDNLCAAAERASEAVSNIKGPGDIKIDLQVKYDGKTGKVDPLTTYAFLRRSK